MKKLLVITAHPDDESFGPGGTLALYAKRGVEVHVVCATRGEAGSNEVISAKTPSNKTTKQQKLHDVREQELIRAARVLGIKRVDFLDFIDGTLNNQQYHLVADKIQEKFETFKPQVVLTYEPRGVSGHLDHVAISFITTYAYKHSKIPKKLYYYAVPKHYTDAMGDFLQKYFVYFPQGYPNKQLTTCIDVSSVWDKKIAAMKCHKSQQADVDSILSYLNRRGEKNDYFIIKNSRVKTVIPENDLFAGIK